MSPTPNLAKDDDFQLDQERQRVVIRIKERRAKAVDFLAPNLRYANPDPKKTANSTLTRLAWRLTLTNHTTFSTWVSYFLVAKVRVFTVSPEPVSGTDR